MSEDWQEDRVSAALRGENPTVMSRLQASFAVIGDIQFLPGYSIAITDTPGVDRLSDLSRPQRQAFLADMDLLGEAVETICARFDSSFLRVNLEILGNTDAFLHAHVWPRYGWEGSRARKPVWLYPGENWGDKAVLLGAEHDKLRTALTEEISSAASASLPS
jgi:diadenosine tetraphosphate (Ap4A) HIT family hydrolase